MIGWGGVDRRALQQVRLTAFVGMFAWVGAALTRAPTSAPRTVILIG
jgi:hypothetical protein